MSSPNKTSIIHFLSILENVGLLMGLSLHIHVGQYGLESSDQGDDVNSSPLSIHTSQLIPLGLRRNLVEN